MDDQYNAPLDLRVYAAFLDGLILSIIGCLTYFACMFFAVLGAIHNNEIVLYIAFGMWYFTLIFSPLIYKILTQIIFKGQTIGKKTCNIRIVTSKPNLTTQILIREVVNFILDINVVVFVVNICLILFNEDHRSAADYVARTIIETD